MQDLQMVASEFIRAVGEGFPEFDLLADKVRKGDLSGLRETVDPCAFTQPKEYWRSKLVMSLLKKCDNLPGKGDTKKAAVDKWIANEQHCYQNNRRLEDVYYRLRFPYEGDESSRLERKFWNLFSDYVDELIGKEPINCYNGSFTKGSTFTTRGLIGRQIQTKLATNPSVTDERILDLIGIENLAWGRFHRKELFYDVEACHHMAPSPEVIPVTLVRGERFDTAPKDSEIDRPIGIQPSGNIFAQKHVGDILRTRLNRIGLLLVDPCPHDPLQEVMWRIRGRTVESAEEKHRRLAEQASIDDTLATIDLSSASDMICFWLVRLAVRNDRWFNLLDLLRTKFTEIKLGKEKVWWKLEKFASMGNGFTFELETLLFYSLLKCVVPPSRHHEISVYGDDMILPSEYYDDAIAALSYAGFVPNKKKSYGSGPFRESCGGDYHSGQNVRPVFIRDVPIDPLDWLVIHNQLFPLVETFPRISGVLNIIRGLVPRNVRECMGPTTMGDCVFHTKNPENYLRRTSAVTTHFKKGVGHLKSEAELRQMKVVLPCYPVYHRDRWCAESNVAAVLHKDLPEEVVRSDESPGYKLEWVCVLH